KLPRYIRITDINKRGELKKDTYKSLPLDVASKYPVENNDILFARSGASVGKTYLHQSDAIASHAGYLIKYRSDNKKLIAKYLYYFTDSYSYKRWIHANIIQATIENISAEKYSNMQIPYPPIEQQKVIVGFLEGFIKRNLNIID